MKIRCPLCHGLRALGFCDYYTVPHCEKCCRDCDKNEWWVPVLKADEQPQKSE
jgi:hypothetical protein